MLITEAIGAIAELFELCSNIGNSFLKYRHFTFHIIISPSHYQLAIAPPLILHKFLQSHTVVPLADDKCTKYSLYDFR